MLRQDAFEMPEIALPVHNIDWSKQKLPCAFKVRPFDQDNRVQQASYPHRHTFYQLQYITGGQGIHALDFDPLPIKPPVIFFISPGQVHYWLLEKPLQGHNLLFGPDFMAFNATEAAGVDPRSLFHHFRHTPLQLRQEQAAYLEKHILLLAEEFKRRESNSVLIMKSYLHILFSTIQRLRSDVEPDFSDRPPADFLRRFRQLVSSYYCSERSIQFYGDRLGMSASYLSEQVKAITGLTAGQIIRQEVVLEAKRLLINTDLTIEQISYRLRFSDPSYFARFFKRETSVSPGKYRQDTREKYLSCEV